MTINNSFYSNENMNLAQLMQAPFATGALIVNFSQNQVTLNGKKLILQPKVLELLVILCAAKGKTLSKQALIDSLWPDTIVGPDSLANIMARLRKILNDDAKSPVFIKTIQRKGYVWLPAIAPIKVENKSSNIKYLVLATGVFLVAIFLFFNTRPAPEKFPFPDLSIQKLPDGGYEIQVGIEGELTEEKKAAMLAELQRITGEEHSGMEFTVDEIAQDCAIKTSSGDTKEHCKKIKAGN